MENGVNMEQKKKKGFKHTKCGLIPQDWECVRLGDVGRVYPGLSTKKKEDFGLGNCFYITFLNVLTNIKIDVKNIEKVFIKKSEKQNLVKKGDLFFNISSETPKEVGMCAVLTKDMKNTYLNSFCLGYRLYNKNIDALFLSYFFNSEYGRKIFYSIAQGSTRYNLSKKYFYNVSIPLPPLSEQQKIAEILETWDKVIEQTDNLIEKKERFKKGLMQKLLTGKMRFPGFGKPVKNNNEIPQDWECVRLGDVGRVYPGLSTKKKEDFGLGNCFYITFLNVLTNIKIDVKNIEKVFIKKSEKQNLVKKGDLFFNISSETPKEVGMCAVLTKDMKNTYLNSFCLGYRLYNKNIDALFLSYFFNSEYGRKIFYSIAQGSTRYNLSKKYFYNVSIPLPPLSEQQKIAEILGFIDTEIELLKKEKALFEMQKKGLMQKLFRV